MESSIFFRCSFDEIENIVRKTFRYIIFFPFFVIEIGDAHKRSMNLINTCDKYSRIYGHYLLVLLMKSLLKYKMSRVE